MILIDLQKAFDTTDHQVLINKMKYKLKLRNGKFLNIVYNPIEIKQHAKVKYLGCTLDESLSGESVALNVIDKINSRVKFLQRQNRFLTPPLGRLHSLVSKSFKKTKIKASSNAK